MFAGTNLFSLNSPALSSEVWPVAIDVVLCSHERVHPDRLAAALANLGKAIVEVETLVADMKTHRDPLASQIYTARRAYRHLNDSKSGKRHAVLARTTWQRACELGFPGNLADWERLMGAGE